jgi:hypothetical protein
MQFAPGYVMARVGILAAVFVVASVCALVAVHVVAPPTPTTKANVPKIITRGHVQAAAGRTKTYHPEKRDQIEPQLYPAVVKLSSPRKVRLREVGRISLRIERDRTIKVAFPKPGDQLNPVRNEDQGDDTVRVYHTVVSDQVTSNLFASSSDTPLASREENPQMLVPDGAAWMWHVTATEPGSRALELELLANVKIDAAAHHYPVGTLVFEIPVDSSGLPGIIYYISEFVGLWQGAVVLATGLVAFAGAVPIVLKLFPSRRRKVVPGAETLT